MDMSNTHDGNGSLLGLVGSTGALLLAEFSKGLHEHLPPLIMDLFQVGAWGATMLLAVLTIWFKFLRPKKNEPKTR